MLWILIIVIIVFILLLPKRKTPNLVCLQAPLGGGKTIYCCRLAKKMYRRNIRLCRRENRKRKIKGWFDKIDYELLEEPLFITNMEFYLSKYKYAVRYVDDIYNYRLPYGTVLLLDEVGSLSGWSQHEFKKFDTLYDDFVRYYRQDTHGGYLIANDQSFYGMAIGFRRRCNEVLNLEETREIAKFGLYIKFSVWDQIDDTLVQRMDKKGRPIKRSTILFFKKGEYDTYSHAKYCVDKKKYDSEYITPVKSINFRKDFDYNEREKLEQD